MKGFDLEILRRPLIARMTAALTICLYSTVFFISPTAHAIAQETKQTRVPAKAKNTHVQKMNKSLINMRDLSGEIRAEVSNRHQEKSSDDVIGSLLRKWSEFVGNGGLNSEDRETLKQLKETLKDLHVRSLQDFQQTENELKSKGISEVILQRHKEAEDKYRIAFDDMQDKVSTVLQAKNIDKLKLAVDSLHETMSQHKLEKSHEKLSPDHLPWGMPDASKTRKPFETAANLKQIFSEESLTVATVNNESSSVQSSYGTANYAPDENDLSETPDIKFTDAIKAKALELDNDPVKIYNWVRNNIEFIPSYGSIQGADYTLQKGAGNAFDTASLLIALLRTANIPARYAYGTVEIPVEKVMNWVGGVNVSEAAQNLLSQGGIPNTGIIRGGKVTHIRVETVWTEAWVDYFPSRGAKNIEGDQWIPMDASFKQYEFIEGLNIEDNVPFDAEGLAKAVIQNTAIDGEQGFIQDSGNQFFEEAIEAFNLRVEEYLQNQVNGSTTDDVFNISKVIAKENRQLAAGLPYQLLTRSDNFSVLPDNLRHKFRYVLASNFFGMEGSRLIAFEQSLPELTGKELALSFNPSTQADKDLVLSYFPKPDPITGEINKNDIPNSLPGYLIKLNAELLRDNESIQISSEVTMGQELYEVLAMWSPNMGWQQSVNYPTAGAYRAIGLGFQGINYGDIKNKRLDAEQSLTKLQSGDSELINSLGRSELMGKPMYSNINLFMAITDLQNQIMTQKANVLAYQHPSYGVFGTGLQAGYFFGVPMEVEVTGYGMDVDRLAFQFIDKNNDSENLRNYLRAFGNVASSLEHIIPEKMYATEENKAEGISATKAISKAVSQGQKIWQINSENVDLALTQINIGASIENEIRNEVLAGREVITHTTPIPFADGTNVGYIISDPITGSSAYKIQGGANGGFVDFESILDSFMVIIEDFLSDHLDKLSPLKAFLVEAFGHVLGIAVDIFKAIEQCMNSPSVFPLIVITLMLSFALMAFMLHLGPILASGIAIFDALVMMKIGELLGQVTGAIVTAFAKSEC